METKRTIAALFALLAILLMHGSSEAMSLCNMDEKGLLACKPSVTPPDPVDPSADCCTALQGADLKCLCSYRNSLTLPSLGIDPDLALGLPPKCGLPLPLDC